MYFDLYIDYKQLINNHKKKTVYVVFYDRSYTVSHTHNNYDCTYMTFHTTLSGSKPSQLSQELVDLHAYRSHTAIWTEEINIWRRLTDITAV